MQGIESHSQQNSRNLEMYAKYQIFTAFLKLDLQFA
jgi:hypothetical protein